MTCRAVFICSLNSKCEKNYTFCTSILAISKWQYENDMLKRRSIYNHMRNVFCFEKNKINQMTRMKWSTLNAFDLFLLLSCFHSHQILFIYILFIAVYQYQSLHVTVTKQLYHVIFIIVYGIWDDLMSCNNSTEKKSWSFVIHANWYIWQWEHIRTVNAGKCSENNLFFLIQDLKSMDQRRSLRSNPRINKIISFFFFKIIILKSKAQKLHVLCDNWHYVLNSFNK